MLSAMLKPFSLQHPTPPTPPKEKAIRTSAIDDALRFLDSSFVSPTRSALDTPPASSPDDLSKDVNSQTSIKQTKRIRFLSVPSFCDEPYFDNVNNPSSSPLRQVRSSSEAFQTKSILKPFSPPVADAALKAYSSSTIPSHYSSIVDMLDSLLKHLAGADRSAKYDAYFTLSSFLKERDDLPDRKLLREKIPCFERYLQNDILAGDTANANKDVKLASQALTLTTSLFFESYLLKGFSEDFLSWLADYSITYSKSPTLSKELTKKALNLFTVDNFSARVLTSSRTAMLLSSLMTIKDRVTGHHIIALRNVIYARLIMHTPNDMLLRMKAWLPLVFFDMLDSSNDVRSHAIDAGMKAAIGFGASILSFEATQCFLAKKFEGVSNYSRIEQAMTSTLKGSNREHIRQIPKIWSVLILLLRHKPDHLERWKELRPWLRIIQRCFNCSDSNTNLAAWHAWNHFVRAISPSQSTTAPVLRALRSPIIDILQRGEFRETSVQIREAAMSSYHLMLFYAFRPSASIEQIDLCWRELVFEVFLRLKAVQNKDLYRASLILRSIFSQSDLRVWTLDRVKFNSREPILANEVPRLDPQWTRQNTVQILGLVEHLLGAVNPMTQDQEQESSIREVWICFLQALKDACHREIGFSSKSRRARAAVFDTLRRLVRADQMCTFDRIQDTLLYASRCMAMIMIAGCMLSSTESLEMTSQSAKENLARAHALSPIMGLNEILKAAYEITNLPDEALECIEQLLSNVPTGLLLLIKDGHELWTEDRESRFARRKDLLRNIKIDAEVRKSEPTDAVEAVEQLIDRHEKNDAEFIALQCKNLDRSVLQSCEISANMPDDQPPQQDTQANVSPSRLSSQVIPATGLESRITPSSEKAMETSMNWFPSSEPLSQQSNDQSPPVIQSSEPGLDDSVLAAQVIAEFPVVDAIEFEESVGELAASTEDHEISSRECDDSVSKQGRDLPAALSNSDDVATNSSLGTDVFVDAMNLEDEQDKVEASLEDSGLHVELQAEGTVRAKDSSLAHTSQRPRQSSRKRRSVVKDSFTLVPRVIVPERQHKANNTEHLTQLVNETSSPLQSSDASLITETNSQSRRGRPKRLAPAVLPMPQSKRSRHSDASFAMSRSSPDLPPLPPIAYPTYPNPDDIIEVDMTVRSPSTPLTQEARKGRGRSSRHAGSSTRLEASQNTNNESQSAEPTTLLKGPTPRISAKSMRLRRKTDSHDQQKFGDSQMSMRSSSKRELPEPKDDEEEDHEGQSIARKMSKRVKRAEAAQRSGTGGPISQTAIMQKAPSSSRRDSSATKRNESRRISQKKSEMHQVIEGENEKAESVLSRSSSSPIASIRSFTFRSVIDTLKGVLSECKNLALGSSSNEAQRRELEDLNMELNKEVLAAARRKG